MPKLLLEKTSEKKEGNDITVGLKVSQKKDEGDRSVNVNITFHDAKKVDVHPEGMLLVTTEDVPMIISFGYREYTPH